MSERRNRIRILWIALLIFVMCIGKVAFAQEQIEEAAIETVLEENGSPEAAVDTEDSEEDDGEEKEPKPVEKNLQQITASDLTLTYGEQGKRISVNVLGDPVLSYRVSDESVLAVSADGTVTTKKIGATKVTICAAETGEYQAAEKEITITVLTSLEKPVFTKAECKNGTVNLAWNQVKGADCYYLYEKVGSGSYEKIATISSANKLSYTKKITKSGTAYTYALRAYMDSGKDHSNWSDRKSVYYLATPSLSVKQNGSVAEIKWTQATGASGYYVYRKQQGAKSWTRIATISSGTTLIWKDSKLTNGKLTYYTVKAINGSSTGATAAYQSLLYLKPGSVRFTKAAKSTKMTVKWSRNAAAGGYQIQYATNRFFHGAKTVTISKNKTTSKSISKLAKNKTYYVRVRSYLKKGGKTYYSSWTESSNVKSTKTAKNTIVKVKKKNFELRAQAKQSVGGYDTVQGGCTDGTYAYYVLYNRKVENCKIMKVRLSNQKVMKVSGVLDISHGNDMTYDSQSKKLVVTHTTGNVKRLSVINPSTLKVEKNVDVTIPEKMAGVSDSELKNLKGFCGIAYNAKRKQYVTFLKSTGDLMILNRNFKPVSYIKPSKKSSLTKQGIDVTDDYILLGYSGSTNVIMVYTWDGTFVTQINLRKGFELENIYHVGSQYYATYYRSYYKTCEKTVKTTKEVDGKTTTATEKQTYKKLMRENYIYKISGI